MFAVTVEFQVDSEYANEFWEAVKKQSENSLAHEEGCLQFDVCIDPDDRARVFLYEIYTSEAAFEVHLATDHFRGFDAAVKDWVRNKTVRRWRRWER